MSARLWPIWFHRFASDLSIAAEDQALDQLKQDHPDHVLILDHNGRRSIAWPAAAAWATGALILAGEGDSVTIPGSQIEVVICSGRLAFGQPSGAVIRVAEGL